MALPPQAWAPKFADRYAGTGQAGPYLMANVYTYCLGFRCAARRTNGVGQRTNRCHPTQAHASASRMRPVRLRRIDAMSPPPDMIGTPGLRATTARTIGMATRTQYPVMPTAWLLTSGHVCGTDPARVATRAAAMPGNRGTGWDGCR